VLIPWTEGLHLRQAADLVQTGQRFRSAIILKCEGRIANIQSILSVIALCAAMGTVLEVEATGEDEQEATHAIEQIFLSGEYVAADELPLGTPEWNRK